MLPLDPSSCRKSGECKSQMDPITGSEDFKLFPTEKPAIFVMLWRFMKKGGEFLDYSIAPYNTGFPNPRRKWL